MQSIRTAFFSLPYLCCVALQSHTASAALTHQYTFNDGTANDSVGTANGTLMGAATVSGGQVHLTGASGTYVNLPGPTIAINTYTDATFEGWFSYNNSASQWQRLFDFGATQKDYVFYTPNAATTPGLNRAAIPSADGEGTFNPPEDDANGGATLSTGTEHYVAVVVDGTSNGGSGTMAVYVDGVLNTAPPSGVNPVSLTLKTKPLFFIENTNYYLGRSNYPADPYLNGAIDEFNIYDNALDASTIAAHYAAGPVPVPEPSTLVLAALGSVALLFARRGLSCATRINCQLPSRRIVGIVAIAVPASLCFMPITANAQIFVTIPGTFNHDGMIAEYNLDGTPINTSLVTGLDYPQGIVASGGHLFVANYQTSTIGECDAATGATINASLISGLPGGLTWLAVSDDGAYLFASSPNSGKIGKYTTSGAVVNAAFVSGGFGATDGIAVSATIYLSSTETTIITTRLMNMTQSPVRWYTPR
jgi:hypothetical protein